MNKEIYAQTTFNNQANGSVFYKEGKLNDPMLGNVNGIFQSWKYSFDTGKQIFKAKDSEKVYEKRLIKDPNGNPRWSQWVEICPGEANGIQAIAINNQPLLLPNADGAIKLQITPQMIDTYTKREIYDMINSKADEIMTSGYIYVHWVDGCETPQEVLEHTFPDGGELSRFYIVEPKAEEGVANKSTYWYFNEEGKWKTLTDLPSLNAFVTQIAFNEHTQDKIIHITAEDREKWDNQAIVSEATLATVDGKIEELQNSVSEEITNVQNAITEANTKVENAIVGVQQSIEEARTEFEDHTNNINKPNSPHITPEEREKLLHAYDNLKDMPEDSARYVIENKNYVKDHIQYQTDNIVKSQILKSLKTTTYSNGDALIAFDENFKVLYAEIENAGSFIKSLKINLNNIILPLNITWQLESNNGWVSDIYSSVNQSVSIEIPADRLPEVLHIKLSNIESSITIGSSEYYVEYNKKVALNVGDENKILSLNFVGPEGEIPKYNGVPLNEITNEDTGSARWGKITGNLDLQQDLIQKVNELVRSKVENPELDEPYRYDIYGNGTIKSIIQNIGEEKVDIIEISNGMLKENKILYEGMKAKVKALRSAGYFVTNVKLVAENIACTNDSNGEIIPVYFETDNIDYDASPSVVGPFMYNWPAKQNFDKIYLRGGKIEYITNAHLEVRYVSFADIKVGLLNELTNKYYNIDISAGDYKVEADNIALKSSEELELLAKIIILGNEDYDYDEEKTSVKVKVYGEEIDERYASRKQFETSTDTLTNLGNEVEELNARVTASEDRIIAAISDIDAKSAEVDGQLADFQEQLKETNDKIDNLDKTVQESIENLLKADEENAEGDASIFGRVTALEENAEEIRNEIEDVKAEYVKKDDLLNTVADVSREIFDLVIGDSGEFTEALRSGTFEKSERILFHKGSYEITDAALFAKVIDFTNIKYVKGESPCKIVCTDEDQSNPINYINTKFECIDIKIGDFIIEKEGKRTLVTEASGKTTINLPEYYNIIQINLLEDAEITFTGGINGKDYTIQVCQPFDVKNVKFTNFFINDNADIEFSNGLENQKSGNKTVIEMTADNMVAKDAFIIKEVIYGILEGANLDGLIKVIAKNTSCKLYKQSIKEKAVSYNENEIIGYYKPGTTFSLEPTILDGFAHNDDGYDYKVVASNGIEIGEGRCEELNTFTVPLNLTEEDEIYVDFTVDPQLVTFEMDPEYEEYTSNLKGFVAVQTKFGTAEIQFNMKSGFYAYAYQKGDETPQVMGQESLPWVFKTPARTDRKNFTVYIRPLFVALFNQFELKTVSSYDFDKTRLCLAGQNEFDIIASLPSKIIDDVNYGKLYTQALLTLFSSEDYSDGLVELSANGKSQKMSLTIPSNKVGETVTFSFGLPNGDVLTKEMYVTKLDQFSIINKDDLKFEKGKYTLNTIVNENRKYSFEADMDTSSGINDFSGKWTISDSNVISIDEIDNNKIVIQAKKIGTAKLSFKSNFTGLSSSVNIEVITHAKAVSGPENMVVKQLAEFTPQLKWYDFNDNVCKASDISDTTGKYVVERGSEDYLIDNYENYLVVTDTSLGAPSKEAFYKFITTDTAVENVVSKVTIVPVDLLISFKTVNDDITGVKVFNTSYFTNELSEYNCKAHPESVVTFIITLKTGVTLPETSIRAMEKAFGASAEKILNVPGRATIDIKMPYHTVEFEL